MCRRVTAVCFLCVCLSVCQRSSCFTAELHRTNAVPMDFAKTILFKSYGAISAHLDSFAAIFQGNDTEL